AVLRRLGWERGGQQRRDGARVRLWKPRAAQLASAGDGAVTVGGDTANTGNHQGTPHMSPVSPAYARTPTPARAIGITGTRGDTGDAGDSAPPRSDADPEFPWSDDDFAAAEGVC